MSEQQNTITRIEQNNKTFILIGTAHVSKHSAEEVKRVIDEEKPNSVCVELDEQRYQAIMDQNRWKNTDIFKIIKEKKATLLLMNLAISSFQKRIAKQFDIKPGQEMIQGIHSAQEHDAELVLADRNIQITFSRVWGGVGVKGRMQLLTQVLAGIFSNETITEEELEKMKSQDTIDSILSEFTESFPKLKKPLIDERDQYLAEKIKTAPGEKVVAVLGAAHVPGIKKELAQNHDLDALNTVPKKSKWPKRLGWIIPIAIVGMMITTFIMNPIAGWQQLTSWLLWNGTFSAIGVFIGLGHPLTAITAFVASPFTSLSPFLAAGWFAGLVQAYIKKPQVADFEQLNEDVYTVKGFWRNKVSRILVIIVLANLGSSIGTLIAGTDVIRVFINNL
ncbi:pheromone shutdown-related protein TraB [Amphibacillus marinus]|uniref:Pheromone shutdown-related protein TraB n=1 Tax=Amphibacillus marinus TaxID=872970 RepID=A0A1H8MDI3_9BACI|nr:TraB/GumN family protein [Amphibacillus marinus]SEO15383.1 pheromone shutdown-related protein TraB [Amphibacillus marinus]